MLLDIAPVVVAIALVASISTAVVAVPAKTNVCHESTVPSCHRLLGRSRTENLPARQLGLRRFARWRPEERKSCIFDDAIAQFSVGEVGFRDVGQREISIRILFAGCAIISLNVLCKPRKVRASKAWFCSSL